ncbi:U32 family peptidase, partial [Candidatus Woesearchaeota archaeon]|nr:U32 family peptidase [Candidatus Woesearchaeota archaeon]
NIQKVALTAKKFGVDAVIASDISVIDFCNKYKILVNISTQMNVSNFEAVKFYSKYSDVIILARELTLKQIKNICDRIKKEKIKGPSGDLVKIAVFIHGALCVSISGKCYMSLAQYNTSANRGACYQTCRRAYRVIDEDTGQELVVDNKYVMSPKDLCTINIIDKILKSGVSILKIEGRGRSPEYVSEVVKVYREAIDSFSLSKVDGWVERLEKVYNRGFWFGGYYLGEKIGEWSGIYGSRANTQKTYLGKVKNYYPKAKVLYFKVESSGFKIGDEIVINGPTTGVFKFKVDSILIGDKSVIIANKGDAVTLKIPEKVRVNDKIYFLKEIHKAYK